MNLSTVWYMLKRINRFGKKPVKPILNPVFAIVNEFTWVITTEDGTIRNQCAMDSLATKVGQDGVYITYNATKEQMLEYNTFCAANKKAIAAEELKNYKY